MLELDNCCRVKDGSFNFEDETLPHSFGARFLRGLGLALSGLLLTSCVSSQPRNITNVCDIFDDRRSWYRAAHDSEERWGIPIAVNMAFIYQESSFRARAKPERTRLLWVLPGPRPSSAFGYAQALDSTWNDYESNSGNRSATRSNFDDAIDFVAWYNANSSRISSIAPGDARNLYFAYHEGNGGYQRRTYTDKQWLIDAANRVQSNSERFEAQLNSCRRELEKNWFQRLLS
jgi:hypothetical protein